MCSIHDTWVMIGLHWAQGEGKFYIEILWGKFSSQACKVRSVQIMISGWKIGHNGESTIFYIRIYRQHLLKSYHKYFTRNLKPMQKVFYVHVASVVSSLFKLLSLDLGWSHNATISTSEKIQNFIDIWDLTCQICTDIFYLIFRW